AKEARDAAYSKISKAVLTIEKIDNEKRILEDELIKLNKTLSQDEYKNLKEKCDHLHEQVHTERAKESHLKSQITDKQVEHIKIDRDGSALYKVNDTATTDAKEARDAAYSKISKAVLTIEKIDNEK
nr:hypothetical protein [Tanacetum cinerariifolium]